MKEMTAEELQAYEWAFEQKRRGKLQSAGAATRYAYTLARYLQRPPKDTEEKGTVAIVTYGDPKGFDWVSVGQGLPVYYVWVLCIERTHPYVNPYCRYRIANRGGGSEGGFGWILLGSGGDEKIDVTHWMYSPEPPPDLIHTVPDSDTLREFSDEQIHNEAARRRWVYKKPRRVAYQRVIIDPDTGEPKYYESECEL